MSEEQTPYNVKPTEYHFICSECAKYIKLTEDIFKKAYEGYDLCLSCRRSVEQPSIARQLDKQKLLEWLNKQEFGGWFKQNLLTEIESGTLDSSNECSSTISLEQREITSEQVQKLQTSIDFLKRDIWNKYTNAKDIETLVIGNVNHIEGYIAKLTSGEQATREEAEQKSREFRKFSQLASDNHSLAAGFEQQLDKAVDVLKGLEWSHAFGQGTCSECGSYKEVGHLSFCTLNKFLSSLSQGTEETK